MKNSENREFIFAIISETLLVDVIDWIRVNLTPEDVFDYDQLEDWAHMNEFSKKDEYNEDDE